VRVIVKIEDDIRTTRARWPKKKHPKKKSELTTLSIWSIQNQKTNKNPKNKAPAIAVRTDALRPLATAVRRARLAGYNAASE